MFFLVNAMISFSGHCIVEAKKLILQNYTPYLLNLVCLLEVAYNLSGSNLCYTGAFSELYHCSAAVRLRALYC